MRTKILISSVISSMLLFSCGTAKVGFVDNAETTFVNTTMAEDGGIYTTCVFSEIQFVGKLAMDGTNDFSVYESLSKNGGEQIDSADFDYVPSTCEVVLKNEADKNARNAFHIRGVYQNPPVFILHANTCSEPLVLFEGKKLIAGTDYTFDSAANKILFNEKFDIDKSSFSVNWLTRKRVFSFGNDYDKFKDDYDKLYDEWIKKFE
ncbi:MAG: hypothetical protein IKP49_01605 [Treponema sp.]|nr:hypothetical protein [Treponema sp.]